MAFPTPNTGSVALPATATQTDGTPLTAVRVNPSTGAPFAWVQGDTVFNGQTDHVEYFGYNPANGGGRINTGEPRLSFQIESDYQPSPDAGHAETSRQMEWYMEYLSKSGAVSKRPIMGVVNRGTDVSTLVFQEFSVNKGGVGGASVFAVDAGILTLFAYAASDTTVTFGRTAGQTVHVYWGSASHISAPNDTYLSLAPGGNGQSYLGTIDSMNYLNVNDFDGGATSALFRTSADGRTTLAARQFSAGQTGDLFQAEDSAGVIFSRFNKAGYFMTRKVAAPADADLVASELSIWLDPTNGAAKAMFKAKQADGTVRTGSLALV